MVAYRIAKSPSRAQDLSGMGAFKNGGRWNSKGTYMLYTSMNTSLAYLENLVHFDASDLPPNLYIAAIEINSDSSTNKLIYELPDSVYPVSWQLHENLENKILGDGWMLEKKFLAIKVRSAVNPTEFNFLLNPLFPEYHDKIKVQSIEPLDIDARLIR
ncbi:MAG TPA: RES family NAD+ phosphorylase [Mucilaginibacter sp.]|jgi:RES domain-containing protein